MREQQKPKRKISCLKVALFLITLLLILIAVSAFIAFRWYENSVNSPAGTAGETYTIEVEEGDTLSTVGPKLVEAGLVGDINAYKIYLFLNKPVVNLQVGDYILSGGENLETILLDMAEGPNLTFISVAIPEGLRYDEIADILEEAFTEAEDSLFSKSEYLKVAGNPDSYEFSEETQEFIDQFKPAGKSLEGFLFPDTYTLGTDADTLDVIELQISTLIRRLEENGIDPANPRQLDTFYAELTMATIVEREANNLADMKLVSDIFLDRFREGTTLGSDAPLLYPKKDWSYEITQQDLDNLNDPYNSRKIPGLPPTPIANPGMDGIVSVDQPTPNDYYFFISADGVNYYAKTLPEHCSNIRTYLGRSC